MKVKKSQLRAVDASASVEVMERESSCSNLDFETVGVTNTELPGTFIAPITTGTPQQTMNVQRSIRSRQEKRVTVVESGNVQEAVVRKASLNVINGSDSSLNSSSELHMSATTSKDTAVTSIPLDSLVKWQLYQLRESRRSEIEVGTELNIHVASDN